MTNEEKKAYMKRWRADNRERIRQKERERRARMTPEQKAVLADRQRARYVADPSKRRADALKWQQENPERAAERKKEWAKKNAAHVKARRKADYELNREHYNAKSVEWNRANKQARKEASARYAAKNPELRRAIKAKRRASERQAAGSFTKADIKTLFATQKGLCAVCRIKLGRNYEADHIEPLSRGGSNERTNLQLLCMPCNRSKGAKDPIEFMQQRGFLL